MLVITQPPSELEIQADAEMLIEDMHHAYNEAQTIKAACEVFDFYRKKIIELFPEHCPQRSELACLNTKLTYQVQDSIKAINSTPSHTIADSNLSKTTTESNQMQVATPATKTNSINIEAMTLQELAALQLQIAQRMNQLLVQNQTEVAVPTPKPIEQPVAVTAPAAEKAKKGAARVKRQAAPSVEPVDTSALHKPAPTATEKLVAASKANKAKAAATPEPVIVKACDMNYADLRSFISKATKSCTGAKAQAQSIARKYNAKSWATVGRAGYEEIYNLIIAK